ncbi:MAG: hypothetical protein HY235_13175 [Acidobacteria bacterium]|nr:hypothetical protein [Acidobacteriota bacterium]
MTAVRPTTLMAAAVAAILVSSCRKKVAAPPAPSPPAIILPRKIEPPPKPPTLPPAPKIETPPPQSPPVQVEVRTPPPTPVPQKKQRPRTARKQEVKPPEVKPPEAKPPEKDPVAAEAGPKLSQILAPDQQREYTRRLETLLEGVRGALVMLQTRSLDREQKESVNRIRIFVAQAEHAREEDLVSAVNLAERADLLSRDLLGRVR